MPLLVGDIEKKMGLHQGERRMWRPPLGVPNKAVSSTSVQMSPVLLTIAALGVACTQGLPQAVSRDRLSGWEQPSW